MKGRARSALGADALRGLLGAEDLESPPAAPVSQEQQSAAARPPKSGKPPRRRTPRRPARSAQRRAPEPTTARSPAPPAEEAADALEQAGPPPSTPHVRRANVQGYIDGRVLERARDTAFWTPGVSLSALIEQGLRAEIARLERERGEPFPPRRGPLTPGPAIR